MPITSSSLKLIRWISHLNRRCAWRFFSREAACLAPTMEGWLAAAAAAAAVAAAAPVVVPVPLERRGEEVLLSPEWVAAAVAVPAAFLPPPLTPSPAEEMVQSPWASSESEGRGGRTSGRLRDVFLFVSEFFFHVEGGREFFFPPFFFEKRCGNKGNVSKRLLSIPVEIFCSSGANPPLVSIKDKRRSNRSRQWAQSSW